MNDNKPKVPGQQHNPSQKMKPGEQQHQGARGGLAPPAKGGASQDGLGQGGRNNAPDQVDHNFHGGGVTSNR